MRTLLIINDNTPEATHAAEFALAIAQKMEANILLANIFIKAQKAVEKVTAGDIDKNIPEDNYGNDLFEHLQLLNNSAVIFRPEIDEFDVSDMNESNLASVINQNQIWMMVKGMSHVLPALTSDHHINIHSVLNKVLCPLLLIPANWKIKDVERLVYLADLRYCRIQIVRHLASFAKPWQASVSVAHLSAKGLPDMEEKYAFDFFCREIGQNVNYNNLFFNNIKEKDLLKAVDVMINSMHNDILVMVNHRFHLEEIMGRYITDKLPLNLIVPLLIFPS